MKSLAPLLLALAAATASADTSKPAPAPSPNDLVAAAPADDWVDIAPDDLLVMTLAPDAKGRARRIIMQLMPAPFSQGWVSNIRALAKAHWYDGNAVYRVQDNYVAQWGDPNEGDKAKKLPDGLKVPAEGDYTAPVDHIEEHSIVGRGPFSHSLFIEHIQHHDLYADGTGFTDGWPVAFKGLGSFSARDIKHDPQLGVDLAWPLHCYGAVGVARGQRPDTGNGATLYTVIGHAPRHLDRNIAVVGRIIEGMEHLSGLPRGTETLGFYKDEADYVPILSVRLASALPAAEQPRLQYLATYKASFARYADARANRRDPFFLEPAGGADICNIPVPIRHKP